MFWLLMHMWMWGGVYVVVVAVMIVVHRLIRRHHTALVRDVIARMDTIVSEYTSLLWRNRSNIYQYDDNVPLLFRTLNDMLHDAQASYHSYSNRWFEDLSYASSLLPDDAQLPDVQGVKDVDESLGRIDRIYRSWGVCIVFLTAGLYLLWQQPLHTS